MTVSAESNNINFEEHLGRIIRIDPPAKIKKRVREPAKLIVELIYLVVAFLPLLLWSIIENIFFSTPKSIRGKVVLVTGSGRGLGEGFAKNFLELGCKVACVDIDETLNVETVKRLNDTYPGMAKAYKCNVAIAKEIKDLKEAVYKDFGHVDILVHNAGLIAAAPLTTVEDIFINGVIAVNLTSHFFMIREFLPDMIKRNEGHIVAVASIASFAALANGSLYVASKHGVLGLMDCLYHELKEIPNNRIKTTTICPYFVNTSALYTRAWKLRIPEMSIRYTVNTAVDGILRNRRLITVPTYLYFFLLLEKLLPDRISDVIRSILSIQINIPPMSFQQKTPLYRILVECKDQIEKDL